MIDRPHQIEALDGLIPELAFLTMMDMKDAFKSIEEIEPKQHILTTNEEKEPVTFRQAWDHPNPESRKKWQEAIRKELHDMNNRKVWRKIKRNQIPQGRRCVKNKWVFKIKRNGTFRARLVACGYSQVPGEDFSEHFAPVVHDITYRILLVAMIIWKLDAKIIDIVTTFLHGDLEEEIYMDCPDGLDHEQDKALLLLQTIYGLVQSARQFWKKLVKVLLEIGFEETGIDPCLLIKKTATSIVLIALYVDDMLCIGKSAEIDQVIKDIKKYFDVKVEHELGDYLSCEIQFNEEKTAAWIGQPHLIDKLETTFGDLLHRMQEYVTPGTPGYTAMKPEEKDLISKEKQSLYRTGVGMFLFLVKHTRPDIANASRELSKLLSGANEAAFKEMLRVAKYVLDTRTYGLKIEPKKLESDKANWTMTMFSDSDFASDKETRISVTGYILFLMGVPIVWKSKSQRGVTLSSSEAEYVALSEAAKEVKFVYQLLVSIGINVKLPITIHVDNVGAIFIGENTSTSGRTKHIDICYRFVKEYVDDKFIEIIFVGTKDNIADLFTKNTSGNVHNHLVDNFLGERLYD